MLVSLCSSAGAGAAAFAAAFAAAAAAGRPVKLIIADRVADLGFDCLRFLIRQRRAVLFGDSEALLHGFRLPELLVEARTNEQALRGSFPSEADQEYAARRLIAGKNPALQEALLSAADPAAFYDFCLTLRGPLLEGRQRRILREQARLLGYLADPAPLPDSAEALLRLWETAYRLEPRWYDDLPAHFRTADDHIPFAHGRNPLEPGPIPPGHHTSPPEEIPEAVSKLTEWIRRRDLSPELLAFSSLFLLFRIHPFSDGNGHTARLLCCSMLFPHYSAVTLTAFIGLMHEFRRSVFDATMLADLSNGDLLPECCVLLRLLIRGQKRLLTSERF